METSSSSADAPDATTSSPASPPRLFECCYYVHHLGRAGCTRQDGRVGAVDLLAQAGLPVPEGMVLSRKAHREFMQTSGLSQGILNSVPASEDAHHMALELRLVHSSKPIEGELNGAICDALIRLGASSVAVISEERTRNDLKSIPEVKNAVREAWLSLEGLTHQIKAACRGEEIPTWPVFVQREINPDCSGWSTTG